MTRTQTQETIVASGNAIELSNAGPAIASSKHGPAELPEVPSGEPPKGTTVVIITCVTCATLISSLLAGLVTIALPTIARDLKMSPGLLLWFVEFQLPV